MKKLLPVFLTISLVLVVSCRTEALRMVVDHSEGVLQQGCMTVVKFLYSDVAMLEEVRYKIYGTKEIYTPLDKVVTDIGTLCDIFKLLNLKNISWNDPDVQKLVKQILYSPFEWNDQSVQKLDNTAFRSITKVFCKHSQTLKSYRQQHENDAQVCELLDKVLKDFKAFDDMYVALYQ